MIKNAAVPALMSVFLFAGSILLGGCGGAECGDGIVAPDGEVCDTEERRECQTSCGSKGTQRCDSEACVWNACDPPAENCNGRDDDCDGASDEDFTCRATAKQPCTTSCGTKGTQTCDESCGWGECVPPPETCGNGVDDDCDGVIDGIVRIGESVKILGEAARPSDHGLIWNGSEYAIVWRDGRDSTPAHRGYSLYTIRVSARGERLGPGIKIGRTGPAYGAVSGSWTGNDYGIVRHLRGEIVLTRISATGSEILSEERLTTEPAMVAYHPAMAWSGESYAVAYEVLSLGLHELYISRATAEGAKVTTPRNIVRNGKSNRFPALAWSGDAYGLAWRMDYPSDRATPDGQAIYNRELHFARLSSSGTLIASRIIAKNGGVPALVWNGSGYGVAWASVGRRGKTHVYFTRISPAGKQTGKHIQLSGREGGTAPSIVWNDREFGVAYGVPRIEVHPYDQVGPIRFVRISMAGEKLGDAVAVSNDDITRTKHSLVWTGNEYGMAWLGRGSAADRTELYFSRFGCE